MRIVLYVHRGLRAIFRGCGFGLKLFKDRNEKVVEITLSIDGSLLVGCSPVPKNRKHINCSLVELCRRICVSWSGARWWSHSTSVAS